MPAVSYFSLHTGGALLLKVHFGQSWGGSKIQVFISNYQPAGSVVRAQRLFAQLISLKTAKCGTDEPTLANYTKGRQLFSSERSIIIGEKGRRAYLVIKLAFQIAPLSIVKQFNYFAVACLKA